VAELGAEEHRVPVSLSDRRRRHRHSLWIVAPILGAVAILYASVGAPLRCWYRSSASRRAFLVEECGSVDSWLPRLLEAVRLNWRIEQVGDLGAG